MCLAVPVLGNYRVKFHIIKLLKQNPLGLYRHLLELKANGKFASDRDMQSILKATTDECAEILRTAGVKDNCKYIFKGNSITKFKRKGLLDRTRPSPILEANIIYNAIISIQKNSDVKEKDRVYIVVEELNAILHDIRPTKKNLEKNLKTFKENEHMLKELEQKEIRLIQMINVCDTKINSARVITEKIEGYTIDNRLHRDNNDRVKRIYNAKKADLVKFPDDLILLKEELARVRESKVNVKKSNDLLKSTISSDKSVLLEAANDLRETLSLYAGVMFRRSFLYNITQSNRNW